MLFRSARSPEKITLGDIIRVLEGPVSPTECVIDDKGAEQCERSAECVMRSVWCRVRDQINAVLDSITLAEIVEEQRKRTGEGYMFYI